MTSPLPMQASVQLWLYSLLLPWHRLLLSIYFRQVVIHGFDDLPVNGPVVLAPKHYSRWDPVVVSVLSVEPLRFMTNANQFDGIQGWLIQRLGAFPVDLARPKVSSFRYAVDLLRSRKKLVLFPEGGIVRDQPVRSLKLGLAHLVQQAEASTGFQIPVVPIAVQYEPGPRFRAKVSIQILPPLYFQHYWQGDKKTTIEVFTQAVERSLREGVQRLGAPAPLATH